MLAIVISVVHETKLVVVMRECRNVTQDDMVKNSIIGGQKCYFYIGLQGKCFIRPTIYITLPILGRRPG